LTILNGFDVDCCQAGIDLATGQLVCSDNFRDFLNTRQLHVTTPVTPFHTAIRLVKKKHELNAYCNIPEEISLLMHVPKLFTPQHGLHDPPYAKFFGKRMCGLYKKYSASLDQYFTVVPFVKTVERHIDNDPLSNEGDQLSLFERKEIIPLSKEGELYTLIPNTEIAIDEAFDGISRTAEFMPIWSSLKRSRKAHVSKFRKANKYFFTRSFSVVNAHYVHCDFHEKHLKKIQRFFSAHPLMAAVFCNLDIQQQLKSIRLVEKMADQHGLYVIGLIEHAFQYIQADEITEERILALIEAYKQEYEDLSVAPLDIEDRLNISEFKFKESVRELLTLDELLEEGKKMRHCVGGYAIALRKKQCRIFHIEYGKESSTLDIVLLKSYFNGFDGFVIFEHRGAWNKEVGIEHSDIGRELVEFLNKKYANQRMLPDEEQIFGDPVAVVEQ
jgi:hypothetical protein